MTWIVYVLYCKACLLVLLVLNVTCGTETAFLKSLLVVYIAYDLFLKYIINHLHTTQYCIFTSHIFVPCTFATEYTRAAFCTNHFPNFQKFLN
jgi:hypothetical protein